MEDGSVMAWRCNVPGCSNGEPSEAGLTMIDDLAREAEILRRDKAAKELGQHRLHWER
jgi:hypothetical protein